MKCWIKRGSDTIEISICQFNLFLYIIKLTGDCKFMKRNGTFDNILFIMRPFETMTSALLNRKRLIAIS